MKKQAESLEAETQRLIELYSSGQSKEARELAAELSENFPDISVFPNVLGACCAGEGQLDLAVLHYRRALEIKPDYAEAYSNLGIAYETLGKDEDALDCFSNLVKFKGQDSESHNKLGSVLARLGRFDAALESFKKSTHLNPNHANAHANLGRALQGLGRFEEAVDSFKQSLEIEENDAVTYNDLGIALNRLGRLEEAITSCKKAIAINPNYAEAHWDLSLVWLTMGNFEKGFREYEWRWHLPHVSPRVFDAPAWDGGIINGQTVLLHAEQGMGDSIQFVRYVPFVSQRGASIILECQKPLVSLFENLEEGLIIVPRDDNIPLPDFDCHAPLLSLPRIFQTTLETIPSDDSYLKPDKVLQSKFQKLMPADSLNVGITWAGKPTHKNDHNRSAGLEPFIELFGNNKITFHSLQVGPRSDDILNKGCQGLLHDHGHLLNDFADTAALISNLDLVISVDTSVCHLSGALGVPCWVILPHTCDWRWMTHRSDSPWYSSIRLFRQKNFGEWKYVFDNIATALMELC